MIKVCKIGKILNLEFITEALKKTFKFKISINNVCFYYEMMKHYGYKNIKNIVLKDIQRWFCILTENKHILNLSFNSIKDLLSNSQLKLSSEIEIFNAADSWIQYDPNKRSKFAIELIKLVRLSLLSSAALDSLLVSRNSFSKCLKSKEYIKNANKIEKQKDFNELFYDSQSRYYIHDSIYMITHSAINNRYENSYQIYKSKEDSYSKLALVKIDEIVLNVLFLNETFYFLTRRSIKSYSILTKNWRSLIKYPAQCVGLCACTLIGKIYIFSDKDVNKNVKFCISFDTKTEKLNEIAPMLEKRSYSACAVLEGRLVLSGGYDNTSRIIKTVEVYDHCANEWSRMPDMLEARRNHASVSIKNKLYMIGGDSSQSEVFDTCSQKFAHLKPMLPIYDFPEYQTKCFTVGNKIFVFKKHLRNAAVFDVDKDEWSGEKDLNLNMTLFDLFYC